MSVVYDKIDKMSSETACKMIKYDTFYKSPKSDYFLIASRKDGKLMSLNYNSKSNAFVYELKRSLNNDFLKSVAKPFKNNDYLILMPNKRLNIDFDLNGKSILEGFLKDYKVSVELGSDLMTIRNDSSLIVLKDKRFYGEGNELIAFNNKLDTSVIVQRLLNSYLWVDTDATITRTKLSAYNPKIEFNSPRSNDLICEPSQGNVIKPVLKDNRRVVKIRINNSLFNDFNLLTNLKLLEELDLSGNMLKNIPSEVSNLRYLKKLNVSDNNLADLPDSLRDVYLDELIISPSLARIASAKSNQRTKVFVNTPFNGRKLLMPLEEYNFLTGIKPLNEYYDNLNVKLASYVKLEKNASIDRITELRVYDTDVNNKLSGIYKLDKLRELVLSNCNISELPDIDGLKLERLNLSNNNISGLVKMPKLEKAVSIDLSNNDISAVVNPAPGKFSYAKLESLNLSENRILSLESDGLFKFITELRLDGNQVDISSLLDLNYLRKLSLCDNRLRELDERIALINSLEELYLDDNNLSHLPESIMDLVNLRALSIQNNDDIKRLPKTMLSMRKLKHLYIDRALKFDPVYSELMKDSVFLSPIVFL